MPSLLTGRRAATLGLIVVAAALGALTQATNALDRAELSTVDTRFALHGPDTSSKNVVVVAIDERSEKALGLTWPLPRAVHAQMLDRLTDDGALAIAYDVPFTEPTVPADPTDERDVALAARQDRALLGAIRRGPNVVLSANTFDPNGRPQVLGGTGLAQQAGAKLGDGRVSEDESGEVHRLAQSGGAADPPFAVVVARAAGADVPDEEFDGDGAWVDYRGEPCLTAPYRGCAIPTYSFSDVLRGEVPRAALRGRVVVVGGIAASTSEAAPTAQSGDRPVPAPEIHGDQISAALLGFPLDDAAGVLIVIAVLVGAALPALGGLRFSLWGSLVGGGIALGTIVALAELAFLDSVVLPVMPPVVAAAVSTAGAALIVLRTRTVRTRRERAVLARFVPASVVDELMERDGALDGLASESLEATVLYCRLQGYTALTGRVDAVEAIAVLDRYLAVVRAAVSGRQGAVLSILGDGVMAVFGAPVARTDHREQALRAAQALAWAGQDELNRWLAESLPGADPLGIGVGLDSGAVSSGVVGPHERREYAAVGDAADVAVQLQALTRDPGRDRCILSAATRHGLPPEWDAQLAPLGRLALIKHAPVIAWALDGEHERAPASP